MHAIVWLNPSPSSFSFTHIHTHTPPHPHIQAFDRHLNMILGDVEETVTTPEIDEETEEEIIRVRVCVWVWVCMAA
jgi:hypothetical protein